MNKQIIKCVVACSNSNGESDFFFVKIKATECSINNGYHYQKAKDQCELAGYEPYLTYGENDCGFSHFENYSGWDSASIFEINEWSFIEFPRQEIPFTNN